MILRILFARILDAPEAVGIGWIAVTYETGDLREWAQRPLQLDAVCGCVVGVVGRDDPFRSDAVLYPVLQSRQDVVLCIVAGRGRSKDLPEDVRTPYCPFTQSVRVMPLRD